MNPTNKKKARLRAALWILSLAQTTRSMEQLVRWHRQDWLRQDDCQHKYDGSQQ
jgi:hypothetical protein